MAKPSVSIAQKRDPLSVFQLAVQLKYNESVFLTAVTSRPVELLHDGSTPKMRKPESKREPEPELKPAPELKPIYVDDHAEEVSGIKSS